MITKRSHTLSVICFTVFAAFDAINPVCAQNTVKSDSSEFWFNFGVGPSMSELAAGGSFSHSTSAKNRMITIRFINNEELSLFSSPSENTWDFGVLYGIYKKGDAGLISISAGAAIVGGIRKGELIGGSWFSSEYESENFATLGLPVNAQLFLKPFPAIGLGLNVFANLNMEEPFAGALLCLQAGHFK